MGLHGISILYRIPPKRHRLVGQNNTLIVYILGEGSQAVDPEAFLRRRPGGRGWPGP